MYRSNQDTIVDPDFLFPIVETKRSRHRSSRRRRGSMRGIPTGWKASLWSAFVTYCIWPLAYVAMNFLWRIALAGVVLWFFFGVSPSYLWTLATWVWGMASYGEATDCVEAARSLLHGR